MNQYEYKNIVNSNLQKSKQLNINDSGKEQMIPVLPELPVTCYRNRFSEDTYDLIDWHWHDEIQFCLVFEGCVVFRIADREYAVERGGGIFIPSGYVHMTKPCGMKEAGYYCLDLNITCFHNLIGNDQLDIFSKGKECKEMVLDPIADENLLHTIAQIQIRSEHADENDILWFYSNLLILLDFARKRLIHSETDPFTHKQNERLFQIMLYIQDHYMEKITLDQLAEQVHISTSECCRFFKHTSGMTIFDYLRQYRITQSKELLRNTDLSVAEIAYACGFNSQSYYTMIFRKETGYTPTEYRNA